MEPISLHPGQCIPRSMFVRRQDSTPCCPNVPGSERFPDSWILSLIGMKMKRIDFTKSQHVESSRGPEVRCEDTPQLQNRRPSSVSELCGPSLGLAQWACCAHLCRQACSLTCLLESLR